MSRRARGNARQKLQKKLQEQKTLEEELQKLNNGANAKESCEKIIKFVEYNGPDPMTSEDKIYPGPGTKCCIIL